MVPLYKYEARMFESENLSICKIKLNGSVRKQNFENCSSQAYEKKAFGLGFISILCHDGPKRLQL